MRLLNRLHQRSLVPAFLVNSLPKAGTHLLAKVLSLFPGIRSGHVHIGQSTLAQFNQPADSPSVTVVIGVDLPHQAPLSSVQQALQRLGKGRYATGHIPFSEEMVALLIEIGMKSLLILRDPRDIVISHADYIKSAPEHVLYNFYNGLSESESIMKSIIGLEQAGPSGPMLLNIYERCRRVLPWASQPFNYVTRFERLVGPRGGGSRNAQIEEIQNIARHLAISYSPLDIERIAEQAFGGTSTFRRGTIGNWRNHFSAAHKQAFKELAGQVLIDLGYESDVDW